jgi:hypothetical protein
VVAEIKEKLSVSKGTTHKCDMEILDLKEVNEM